MNCYADAKSKHGLARYLIASAAASGIEIYLNGKTVRVKADPPQLKIWNTVLYYHRHEIRAYLKVQEMLAGLKHAKLK